MTNLMRYLVECVIAVLIELVSDLIEYLLGFMG